MHYKTRDVGYYGFGFCVFLIVCRYLKNVLFYRCEQLSICTRGCFFVFTIFLTSGKWFLLSLS